MHHSAIYFGTVAHERSAPVQYRFQYRLWMAYLDLAELPDLVGPGKLLSDRKFAAASFLRNDHGGDSHLPLDDAYRQLVLTQTGILPAGPIRLLTLLRHWGYHFSPLNLAYCFDRTGQQVEFIVAEVSNTPWRERHCYVLWSGNAETAQRDTSAEGGFDAVAPDSHVPLAQAPQMRYVHRKEFHVSPFMDMQATYHWKITPPGNRLTVRIASEHEKHRFFRAGMSLARMPLNRANLRRALVANPCVPAKVMVGIYYQALRLWMKNAPYFPPPRGTATA
jgi:DUF1365 family protein